jgi:WD40 repeat protein
VSKKTKEKNMKIKSFCNAVKFLNDNDTVITAGQDNITGWNLSGGEPTLKWDIVTDNLWPGVTAIAVTPDGGIVAAVDATIVLWENQESMDSWNKRQEHLASVARQMQDDDYEIHVYDIDNNNCHIDGLRSFAGHCDTVTSVAISPDGKTLASGSSDNTIKIWDVGTGDLIRTLEGHGGKVQSVAISPDGKTLASGSEDNTIKIWDVSTGTLNRTLEGHNSPVYDVIISPDGKTLATGGGDAAIKIWDVGTGDLIRTLEGHEDTVQSVCFSPDGKTLASGGWDVRLWDVGTGKLLRTLEAYWDEADGPLEVHSLVQSVAISPDGSTLATGDGETTIIWAI